jgi:UPF0176 protein
MTQTMSSKFLDVAFYQFATIRDLHTTRTDIRIRAYELGLKGTILLSEEGINGTLSGDEKSVRELIALIESMPPFQKLTVKESWSNECTHVRMLVKLKKEIIPLGRPDIKPSEFTAQRLLPADLKKWLDEGKDLVLVDTRNEYEIDHGTFKGAIRMGLRHFRNFPRHLKDVEAKIPNLKDRTVVMFCTGGIRCEKATALALKEDYKDVYQLEGGILRYFEDCGEAHYDGSCFVFDQRIALKPDLSPAIDAAARDAEYEKSRGYEGKNQLGV